MADSQTLKLDRGLTSPKQFVFFLYFLLFLTGLSVLSLFFPTAVNLPLMVLFPSVIFFIKAEVFEKLKLGTLIVGRLLISLTALNLFSGSALVIIVIWLLRINILEATVKDFMGKRYGNAIAGLVQIITSFGFTGEWMGTYYVTDQSYAIYWIIGYTIWNWNFVNLNFSPSVAYYHVGVLLAPLLWVFVSWIAIPGTYGSGAGFWLVMRGATLTLAVMNQILFKDQITEIFENDGFAALSLALKTPTAQIIMSAAVVILSFATAFLMWL